MKLIRYEHPAQYELDRIFGQSFPAMSRFTSLWDDWFDTAASNTPRADFYEDEQHYFIRVELPGIKRDAVDLNLEKHVLTLSAQQREGDGQASNQVTVHRSFTLPEAVKQEAIEARMEDGILTITLPKQEASKPRQIDVK